MSHFVTSTKDVIRPTRAGPLTVPGGRLASVSGLPQNGVRFSPAGRDRFMSRNADTRTSPTLLGRLRQPADDQAAWAAFVDRYGPLILGWCRAARLQDADAEDVT